MKNSVLSFAVAIALATTCFAQATKTNQASAEKAVTAAEQPWADADVKGDSKALAKLMADDMTDTSWDGTTTNKAQDVESLKSGKVKWTEVDNGHVTVHSYGNIAVATGVVTLKGTVGGKDINGHFAFTDVWHHIGGDKWVCIATQVTKTT